MNQKLLALSISFCVLSSGSSLANEIPGLAGEWKSIACELRPQKGADGSVGEWWLTRSISMTDERINAEFTTYADAGCQQPVQILSFAGSVEVIEPSSTIKGAFNSILTINEYVRFTPLTEGFAGFLNTAGNGKCGIDTWVVGESQDVLETGCTVLGLSPKEPTIEYEILGVFDDHLYFAARPVDGGFMTTPDKRVNALQVPLTRK